MNEPIPYAQADQTNQPAPEYVQAPPKHECHCAPDAPCRVSGQCKCIRGLQKILGNIEVKDE